MGTPDDHKTTRSDHHQTQPIRAGETISAGAISEPDHGSDASYMSTIAVEDGDD